MNPMKPAAGFDAPLASSQIDFSAWAAAGRRVIAQLITALIHESLLPDGMVSIQAEPRREAEIVVEVVPGSLRYRARAHHTLAYNRLLITEGSIRRVSNGEEEEADDPMRLLADILPRLPGTVETHARFAEEILQTWSNHAQALCFGAANCRLASLPYEEAESALTDGHRYHPCFKSRIGFSPQENLSYGPEFGNAVRPIWLAVHEDLAASRAIGTEESQDRGLLAGSIDESSRREFAAKLASAAGRPGAYHWLPVHPWQWERIIEPGTFQQRKAGLIVLLGESGRHYLAQQSIRTLSDISDRRAPSLKLSLSIRNTSTARTLARHTVLNAPVISAWLEGVASSDRFLTEAGAIFLLERMGSAVTLPRDADPLGRLAGALAAIWRDPVGRFLADGERAMPFSLLTHVGHDGRPAIADWFSRHGAEAWTSGLLRAAMRPVVHLLLAHGIAVESHQQNMILVHRDGWPTRVALKDFHDGVRFIPSKLRAPRPDLVPTPAEHARVNPNSYVEASDPEDVRDFMFDALFGVNLAELAWFLDHHFGFRERRFWLLAADILRNYLQENDSARAGVTAFRLLDPTVAVEDLARRRLETDALSGRRAPNPLAAFIRADEIRVPS
ncbi:IucA/IucC family protein [Methylocystis suflitae]|uniref:IucA/IucC family protein n=1 Tax=Methylocystis suflitae TaxID=2951405 RepID=UPI00210CC93A|nr:IucA/IucC family protein [Methylocystis suflitae]MCQ4189572.1 IucA/IucC family siderophore biosynthesis protein [Methylocystis suflitae]